MIPIGNERFLTKRFVSPYKSSPNLSIVKTQIVAPRPDENVRPYFALSKEAKHASNTFLIGLPDLLYLKPPCFAGAYCLKVVD